MKAQKIIKKVYLVIASILILSSCNVGSLEENIPTLDQNTGETFGNTKMNSQDVVILRKGERFNGSRGTYLQLETNGTLVYYDAFDRFFWFNSGPNTGEELVLLKSGNLVLRDVNGVAIWSTNTFVPGSTLVISDSNGDLELRGPDNQLIWSVFNNGTENGNGSRAILRRSSSFITGNGSRLGISADGLFTLQDANNIPIWYPIVPAVDVLLMRADGNMVLLDTNNQVIWETGTSIPGSRSGLDPITGELQVVSPDEMTLWTLLEDLTDNNSLIILDNGEALTAANGYKLTLRSDGVLVLLDAAGQVIWFASGPNTAELLVIQPDGNMVLLNSNNQAIWSTGTNVPGSRVNFDFSNGDLQVIGPNGQQLWSIFTS